MFKGRFKVTHAGVNSVYGGGAIFVSLQGVDPVTSQQWYQVPVQWESQILAVALAAIASNFEVDAEVGTKSVAAEVGSSGEPMIYTFNLIAR